MTDFVWLATRKLFSDRILAVRFPPSHSLAGRVSSLARRVSEDHPAGGSVEAQRDIWWKRR